MQCSRMISFARATYNKCLWTTDCNLVCSLEQESHTAPFMLSVHSPDNVFTVLVHIFISNHDHFMCSLLPLSCSARNHCFMTYWNIEHNTLKTYWRTDGRMDIECHLYVSALWYIYIPRQKWYQDDRTLYWVCYWNNKHQISWFPTCHIILNMQ